MKEAVPMMNSANQDIWDAKQFLIHCAQTHPKAQIGDYVKRLYQSEFGGGHLLREGNFSLEQLREEIANLTDKQKRQPYFDPFCGGYCRMNLSISKELSPEMMYRIFAASAQEVPKTAWFRFEEKMRLFRELCGERSELFPFTVDQVESYLREYGRNGYGPVRHSEEYKKAYEPAYLVVRKEYGWFAPLFGMMERCLQEKGSVSVAIDGNSCAGKSTAAGLISSLFDCNVFHADDFFLPLEKRTPERLAEVGGNMDRERMREEILEKVREGKPFSYRPFKCSVMKLGDPVEVDPRPVNIFEGSYSMHPELREYYDIKVFLSVSPAEQKALVLKRNGRLMLRRFLDEWIPKENVYFEQMKVREACDLVF